MARRLVFEKIAEAFTMEQKKALCEKQQLSDHSQLTLLESTGFLAMDF
jgi:hypothetical protein